MPPDAGERLDASSDAQGEPDAPLDAHLNLDAMGDLDAGVECRSDLDCDDGVACTTDTCAMDECVHAPRDRDGDGHPDSSCVDARGRPLGDDCDDLNASRYPGAREVCEPGRASAYVDEDCDLTTLGGMESDLDQDGFLNTQCCNADNGGALVCGDDCNDQAAWFHPGAMDHCGGADEDCDGRIDEAASTVFYLDEDRDGHGGTTESIANDACTGFDGFGGLSEVNDDCDDTQVGASPGQNEYCDHIDNDCDSRVDEGIHCGDCECDLPNTLRVSCAAGPAACVIDQCAIGYSDCDGNPTNGCEIRLGDRDNCQFCGQVCGEGSDCAPVVYPWSIVPTFQCRCDRDRQSENGICEDMDGCEGCGDCSIDNGGCDALTACAQDGAQRTCGACPAGYAGSGVQGCRPVLLGLDTGDFTLGSELDPRTHLYLMSGPWSATSVTLTPRVAQGVSVLINGVPVDSDAPSVVLLQEQAPYVVVELRSPGRDSTRYVLARESRVALIKASDPQPSAKFGTVALSADGSTMVVGSRRLSPDPDGGATVIESLRLYVFERDDEVWRERDVIDVAGALLAGWSQAVVLAVSADGGVIALGAPWLSAGPSEEDANAGGVYVYARSAEGYALASTLTPVVRGGRDNFGFSVALSDGGDLLVVGAPGEGSAARGVDGDGTDNDAPFSGAAYVFVRQDGSWVQHAFLKASNADPGDMSGHAVATCGNADVILVGAPGEGSAAAGTWGSSDDNSAPFAGAVYAFERQGSGWVERDYLKATNTGSSNFFGMSLACASDASTVVVGAPIESGVGTGVNGTTLQILPPPPGRPTPWFGTTWIGAAYVYARDGDGWSAEAYLKPVQSRSSGGGFGRSVAVDARGELVVVAGTSLPLAAAFRRGAAGVWTGHAIAGLPDAVGSSMALSADGLTLALGAPDDDRGGSGMNPPFTPVTAFDSGAVYVWY